VSDAQGESLVRQSKSASSPRLAPSWHQVGHKGLRKRLLTNQQKEKRPAEGLPIAGRRIIRTGSRSDRVRADFVIRELKPSRSDKNALIKRGQAGMPVLPFLEVQFQAKLKLSRVKRRCGLAEVTTIAGALLEGIHIIDKTRSGSFIEAIEEVETLGNQIQPHALA
jgi:hypothetical protein